MFSCFVSSNCSTKLYPPHFQFIWAKNYLGSGTRWFNISIQVPIVTRPIVCSPPFCENYLWNLSFETTTMTIYAMMYFVFSFSSNLFSWSKAQSCTILLNIFSLSILCQDLPNLIIDLSLKWPVTWFDTKHGTVWPDSFLNNFFSWLDSNPGPSCFGSNKLCQLSHNHSRTNFAFTKDKKSKGWKAIFCK